MAISGYWMGGYGTYKLGLEWPDLFGAAFTTVGPPALGAWVPPGPPSGGQDTNSNLLVENGRWVPYLNWAGRTDTLVPYVGVRAQQARRRARPAQPAWTYPGGHFDLAGMDEWAGARTFLDNRVVLRDLRRADTPSCPPPTARRLDSYTITPTGSPDAARARPRR